MEKNINYIAVNVRYYREKAGMSQYELARRLKISQPAVANYETGKTKPERDNLIALADIFGVTVDELCKPVRN